jgi:hypothetical protein
VTVIGAPFEATRMFYIGAAPPQGWLEVKQNFGLKLRVLTMPETICTYKLTAENPIGEMENATGAADAKVVFPSVLFTKELGGAFCPTEGEFSATYRLRRTNPNGKLYVAS